ncbi:hypothetical protein SISSUDRAFT_1047798 [Sistotremastrum suecicum HHB10207 ss-3]|uniref:Uncharacterized protein n=1 Tax=Sistotremastrum suecicum HHB10207 ss-3 TaxID=1314776 RepID=A0A166CY57_9AGAM|nr:hypothetical protein SISSUDRAFT_1047798 [Sistotremastrum suecicum HHB10207 ss-3]
MNPVTIGLVLKHHRHTIRALRCPSHPQSMPMLAPEAEAAIEAADLPQPGAKKLDLKRLDYLGLGAMTTEDVNTALNPFTLPPRHKLELILLPDESDCGGAGPLPIFPSILHEWMRDAKFLKVTTGTSSSLMTVTYGTTEYTHTIFIVLPRGLTHRRAARGSALISLWPNQMADEIATYFTKAECLEMYGILPNLEQWRSILRSPAHYLYMSICGPSADELIRCLRARPQLAHGIKDIKIWLLGPDDPLNPHLPRLPSEEDVEDHTRRFQNFLTLAKKYFRIHQNLKTTSSLSSLTTRFYSNAGERWVRGYEGSLALSPIETSELFPGQMVDVSRGGWAENASWYLTCVPPPEGPQERFLAK